ncbi:MAG: hypothetical protein DPW15_16140 [Chloroflexi bacterium]|nr:hypothetical protein [Anaerolineales bacterium]MCQ3954771.1 hypothetical protein [Chloroflexota bacterium]NUQ58540.1 hypothetical protein [Anaerolineales bacterium]
MKELMEYREKMLARLREAAAEFCEICRSFKDPHANTEGDWTAHQIAFHVRDIEREVYGMRIRRALIEENPLFKNFDPDAWMAAHYNRDEPMQKILDEFWEGIRTIADQLRESPQEVWSRMSRHEALGGELTLQLWVERSLAHIEEHLTALQKAQKQ